MKIIQNQCQIKAKLDATLNLNSADIDACRQARRQVEHCELSSAFVLVEQDTKYKYSISLIGS